MKSSVSSPYIYIKLKEKPTAQKKRIVFPKSLDALRKQAQILFQSPKPITTFYTEDGTVIQAIEDLIPSTTILASTLGGATDEDPPKKYQIKRTEIPKMHGALIDMGSSDSDKGMNDQFEEEEGRGAQRPLTLKKKARPAPEPAQAKQETSGEEILVFNKRNENKRAGEDPLVSDDEDELRTDSEDEPEEVMAKETEKKNVLSLRPSGSGKIRSDVSNGSEESGDKGFGSGKGVRNARNVNSRGNTDNSESSTEKGESGKGAQRNARQKVSDARESEGSWDSKKEAQRNARQKVSDARESSEPSNEKGDSGKGSEASKGRRNAREVQPARQNGKRLSDLGDSEGSYERGFSSGKGGDRNRKNSQAQKQSGRGTSDAGVDSSNENMDSGKGDAIGKGRSDTRQGRQNSKRINETRKETTETSNDKAYDGNEEEDELDEESGGRNVLEEMLGVQFCYGDLENDVDTVFRNCDRETQRTYRRMVREMKRQQRSFFQNSLSRLSCFDSLTKRDELTLGKAIVQRADEIVSKFRVVEPGLVAHNLHAFIVGPRESGKSTLLAFVAERLLVSLIRSQTYKRNLVLIFDAKKLSVSFENYKEFYNSFVDIVFDAVATQRPGFVEFQEAIAEYFKEIANGVSETALPKRFVTNELFKPAARGLSQLGAQLRKCYSDPSAFEEWHTNVLLMPSLVAAAFGFTQVHYIIDNVEYLDAQITPGHPFVSTPINIIEYFLYAFSSASYVLACENFDDCMNVFSPNDKRINIMRDSSVFDVFGMEGDVVGHDKAFMLRFDGDPRLFRFSVEDCCGCPAFLSFWEEICREVESNKDTWSVDITEYNEQQTTVREYLQHLLKQVFVVDATSEEAAKLSQNEILEIRPIKSVA